MTLVGKVDPSHDISLVGLIRSRDDEVFADMYQRYTPRLRAFVASLVGADDDLADDLVHDTWILALDGAPSFRGEASFWTWLSRLCRKRTYTVLGARRRHSRLQQGISTVAVTIPADQVTQITLERELTGLNALELRVLFAHSIEGYAHSEIARSLDVPVGTCRSALSRARKRLRDRLA